MVNKIKKGLFMLKITKMAALLAMAAIIAPTVAFAQGGGRGQDDGDKHSDHSVRAWTTNEFGVRVLGSQDTTQSNEDSHGKSGKSNRGLHLGQLKHGMVGSKFFYGIVTATSTTGFTMELKDDSTLTVDAADAKIIQTSHEDIALADISDGDKVSVIGTKFEDTVNAVLIYVVDADLQRAMASGTVTEVNDNSFTVQTTDDTTITVNTDDNTKFTNEDGEEVADSEIEVGVKAKLVGFWDSVLNVFNAVKVKLLE